MRDRESFARSVLSSSIREFEQASREYVEMVLAEPPHEAAALEAALEKCRKKLRAKSEASKQLHDVSSKSRW